MFSALSSQLMVSTYQDEGVVVTTFEDATGSHVQQVPFTLRFKQANFFRFEWISYLLSRSGTVNTVWCNGKESFTYLEPNAYEQYDDIGGAVAAATGVSSGSIHTIPRLLLPDKVMGSDLTEILEPAFSREEIIEGVTYHEAPPLVILLCGSRALPLIIYLNDKV
jgi:hypothetical protein